MLDAIVINPNTENKPLERGMYAVHTFISLCLFPKWFGNDNKIIKCIRMFSLKKCLSYIQKQHYQYTLFNIFKRKKCVAAE